MAHARIAITSRGRLFLTLILFSLAATAFYLYGSGLELRSFPPSLPTEDEQTLFADNNNLGSSKQPADNLPVVPLQYPLPAPHILRRQYTDEELEQFVPEGCPKLPWRRNLTQYPIILQSHRTSAGDQFTGKIIEGCRWPCAYSANLDWKQVDAQYFDLFGLWLNKGKPVHDESYGDDFKRACPLQRYVLWGMEADSYYPIIGDPKGPDFGFDISMTYKLDSDAPTPYFSDIGYDFFQEPLSFETKNKTSAFATAFISNCNPTNDRNTYQRELQDLIPVDSFGLCHRNADMPGDPNLSRGEFKREWMAKYLFTLAFENSNTKDYVTEKVYQALVAGTVPIYIGAPNIDDLIPSPGSIIKATDFKSPAALAKHLRFLRDNPKEYEKYLAWKKQGPDMISEPFKTSLAKNRIDSSCRVCGVLAGEDVGW